MLFKITRVVVAVAAVAGLAGLPAIYWAATRGVPARSPAEARAVLDGKAGSAVLVDVREPDEIARLGVDGALVWPEADILALSSAAGVPEHLRDRDLILLCSSGHRTTEAARHLRDLGISASHVEGGLAAWIQDLADEHGAVPDVVPGRGAPGVFRQATLTEERAQVFAGFVIKPTYMLLAIAIAMWLRRRREPVVRAVRYGMLAFFWGEFFCAANYLQFDGKSLLVDYLHSYGMLLCFSFLVWAALTGLDDWMIHLSADKKQCAALPLCRACIKYEAVPCGLERCFLLLTPALAVVAAIPMAGEIDMVSYNSVIFGTLYNYSHPTAYQTFEMVVCPLAAILLFVASFAVLWWRGRAGIPSAKLLFAAAAGPAAFGLMRFGLFSSFRTNLVWFDFWEEVTELILVVAVGIILWYFRRGLFHRPAEPTPEGQ